MNETWTYAKMFARYPFALRRFLHNPLTLDRAQAIVRKRMEQRAESFLGVVERAVSCYAARPYLALLRYAGCELGDLRALVVKRGLEGARYRCRPAQTEMGIADSRSERGTASRGLR